MQVSEDVSTEASNRIGIRSLGARALAWFKGEF
jgi:hypothetical protein